MQRRAALSPLTRDRIAEIIAMKEAEAKGISATPWTPNDVVAVAVFRWLEELQQRAAIAKATA